MATCIVCRAGLAGRGSGSGRFVYQLGYRGQRVVWPQRRARTPEETGVVFLEHTLAIAELVVSLVEAERAGACRELAIETEPAVWRRYSDHGGQTAVLKPDLGVGLLADGTRLAWFVEVDRATQGLRRIRAKASDYLAYWRLGQEQARLGVFPRVLWSVPGEERAAAVRGVLRALPEPAAAMFAISTAEATTATLLSGDDGETPADDQNEKDLKGGDG